MEKKYHQYYDNILGYINFPRDSVFAEILHDPFFLRLHNIKQMGLAYYVFPDALHTRFSHSLGVYEIIDRIIKSQDKFSGSKRSQPPVISPSDAEKITLCALLHDIGHLPLSHTIEHALQRFEDDKKTLLRDPFFDDASTIKNEDYDVKLHERLGDEVIASTSIGEILKKHKFDPNEISAGFKGKYLPKESDAEDLYASQIRNFLHSQLDADRLDYLLRDSQFSGVKTGGFDFDKLMNSIVYNKQAEYGVDISAVRAVEQFLWARFSAYSQIVGNKRISGFDYMAQDFYYRLLKLCSSKRYKTNVYSYEELVLHLKDDPSFFLDFTDDHFFSIVKEAIDREQELAKKDAMIALYANRIRNVQPLVPVTYCEVLRSMDVAEKDYEKTCFIANLRSDEELKAKIAEEAGVKTEHIIIPEASCISLYKGAEKDKPEWINLFSKHKKQDYDISRYSGSVIGRFADQIYCMHRIYTFERDDRNKLIPTLKKYAKQKRFHYKGDLA